MPIKQSKNSAVRELAQEVLGGSAKIEQNPSLKPRDLSKLFDSNIIGDRDSFAKRTLSYNVGLVVEMIAQRQAIGGVDTRIDPQQLFAEYSRLMTGIAGKELETIPKAVFDRVNPLSANEVEAYDAISGARKAMANTGKWTDSLGGRAGRTME